MVFIGGAVLANIVRSLALSLTCHISIADFARRWPIRKACGLPRRNGTSRVRGRWRSWAVDDVHKLHREPTGACCWQLGASAVDVRLKVSLKDQSSRISNFCSDISIFKTTNVAHAIWSLYVVPSAGTNNQGSGLTSTGAADPQQPSLIYHEASLALVLLRKKEALTRATGTPRRRRSQQDGWRRKSSARFSSLHPSPQKRTPGPLDGEFCSLPFPALSTCLVPR